MDTGRSAILNPEGFDQPNPDFISRNRLFLSLDKQPHLDWNRYQKSVAVHHTIEHQRLAEDRARVGNWKRWGPYLSERQWGTVREDYSSDGSA